MAGLQWADVSMFRGTAAKHRSFMWFQYFSFCLTSCG
jgi:hypothetical protein